MTKTKKTAINGYALTDEVQSSAARPVGQWLLNLPGPKALHTLVRSSFALAEPPEFFDHRLMPRNPAQVSSQKLTILSANLWHDWPRHRQLQERLKVFAQLVEEQQADLLLLQEVARIRDLEADQWLADRLGMAYVYARANGRSAVNNFEEGLAIFSRFPLVNPTIAQLDASGWPLITRRLALGATAKTPWGDFLAISTHLGLSRKKNARQIIQLRRWVTAVAGRLPAIIGGDFNTPESSHQLRLTQNGWIDVFRHLYPADRFTTYQFYWPWGSPMLRMRLDYLFLKPGTHQWQILDAGLLDSPGLPHSDHRAILTRLSPPEMTLQH